MSSAPVANCKYQFESYSLGKPMPYRPFQIIEAEYVISWGVPSIFGQSYSCKWNTVLNGLVASFVTDSSKFSLFKYAMCSTFPIIVCAIFIQLCAFCNLVSYVSSISIFVCQVCSLLEFARGAQPIYIIHIYHEKAAPCFRHTKYA